MVAPLIAGASRVTGTKAATRLRQKSVNNTQRSRRIDTVQQQTKNVSAQLLTSKSSKGTLNKIQTFTKRIKATSAAGTIFWSAIPFYVPQFAFWMISIAGIGLESTPLVNYVIPGTSLLILSYIVILLIGVSTMVYAAILFTLRGVDSFGGMKGIVFIVCLAGYLVIFVNFFPWFVLWLASVIYLQNED